MRLRYYDPAVGRFVSRDPLGLWGDPAQNGNGQSYCGHNPVNWTDPFGDSLLIPNSEKAQKFMNRVAQYAGVKFKYRPLTDEEVERELKEDEEAIKEEAEGDPNKQKELEDARREDIRKGWRAVEIEDRPPPVKKGQKPPSPRRRPGVTDEDLKWTKTKRSKTLRKRIEDAIKRKLNLKFILGPAEKSFYLKVFFVSELWDNVDCLKESPKDPDFMVIRFAHELWRALYDPPEEGSESGESRKHTQEKPEYFDDPVWKEGEKPVRDELGM